MATNLSAPNGLSFARNWISGANTYQANVYFIKNGYGSNIGVGDLVKTGTSTNQGYVVLATTSETGVLGVFAGVLPYYDATLAAISHGVNGQYTSTANPPAGVDVPCLVISDPFATFLVQSNGTYVQSWRGNNCNFVTATNGAPNYAGRSTLQADGTNNATTATFPFRIVGVAGVTGGPQDPANVNPLIEVRLNISEALSSTGI